MIHVNLFDQERYQVRRGEGEAEMVENRFLGGFVVPLLSVLTNPGKTEFNFKVNRPLCLPNYKVLKQDVFFIKPEDMTAENLRKNEQISTYLTLSLSLDPAIELPDENEEEYYPGFEPNS